MFEFDKLEYTDKEPKPDLACCSQCEGRYPIQMCDTDEEGDWESGYYEIHLCPFCEDGGCIDDYDYTSDMGDEWEQWYEENNNDR